MPITRDPYSTYMGRQLEQGVITNAREQVTAYMQSKYDDPASTDDISPYLSKETKAVYGVSPLDWRLRDTPYFAHPMVINNREAIQANSIGGFDNFQVVADLRSMFDKDRNGKVKIVDHAGYTTIAARAVIMQWWLSSGTVGPLRSMPVAVSIFAELIGEMMGSIKMEMDDAQRLRVWAGIWYYMAHMDEKLSDLKPADQFSMVKFLSQHMRVTAQYVTDVLNAGISAYDDSSLHVDRDDQGTVRHWFALAPLACESVRLESVMKDIGVFFGMIGKAYYDPLKVETMGIAFDHPPTFLALIYSAANNFTSKSSDLSKIVARPIYRDGVSQLVRGISRKLA